MRTIDADALKARFAPEQCYSTEAIRHKIDSAPDMKKKPAQIKKEEYEAFCSVCEMFDYRASVLHDEEDYSGVERMGRAIDDYWDDLNPAGVALDGESEEAKVDFQIAKKKCDGLRAVRRLMHALIGSGALEFEGEKQDGE